MSRTLTISLLVIVVAFAVVQCYKTEPLPKANPKAYWGAGNPRTYKEDTRVHKYDWKVDDKVLTDLNVRLDATIFPKPLPNVNFTYGFNEDYLKTIVRYWRNEYKWRTHEAKIKAIPNFKTQIEGLNVHFLHAKPEKSVYDSMDVVPLLLVHGWPGSIAEFLDFIPMLTTPRDGFDFVFEVVAPSIPGYPLSDAPQVKGFGQVACAQVFDKLMSRLKLNSYYVQGGDWGSVVVNDMAVLYPDRVKGMHTNAVFLCPNCDQVQGLASYFAPPQTDVAFLNGYYNAFMQETGYLHEQASKPDTIGMAVSNSPAAMASYVLEKMSWATNYNGVNHFDGLLPQAFTNDQLLTNLMLYWVTGCMTSSMRFYKEHWMPTEIAYNLETYAITVPAAVAVFPFEPIMAPLNATSARMNDLVSYNNMPRGGHFAALQVPDLLAGDVFGFVKVVKGRATSNE